MIDLKRFRKVNKIKQQDLASYLGVVQGFISQLETGGRPVPSWILDKIRENEYGWDTGSLISAEPANISARVTGNGTAKVSINNSHNSTASDSAELNLAKAEIIALKKEIESLNSLLKKVELEKERYWDMIQKLIKP